MQKKRAQNNVGGPVNCYLFGRGYLVNKILFGEVPENDPIIFGIDIGTEQVIWVECGGFDIGNVP